MLEFGKNQDNKKFTNRLGQEFCALCECGRTATYCGICNAATRCGTYRWIGYGKSKSYSNLTTVGMMESKLSFTTTQHNNNYI